MSFIKNGIMRQDLDKSRLLISINEPSHLNKKIYSTESLKMSKISTKIDQSIMNLSNIENESFYRDDKVKMKFKQLICEEVEKDVTVNYLVNISKNEEKLMTTQIRVDTYTTVKKLLKIAIKRFNISLNKNSGYLLFEQFILKLKMCISVK